MQYLETMSDHLILLKQAHRKHLDCGEAISIVGKQDNVCAQSAHAKSLTTPTKCKTPLPFCAWGMRKLN